MKCSDEFKRSFEFFANSEENASNPRPHREKTTFYLSFIVQSCLLLKRLKHIHSAKDEYSPFESQLLRNFDPKVSIRLLYKVQYLFCCTDAVSVEIRSNSRQKTPSVQQERNTCTGLADSLVRSILLVSVDE